VAAAIVEPSQKIKPTDVPNMVMLCAEMHRRYDGFASVLVPSLMSGVTGGPGGDDENTLPKRLCLRILTEFVLHGIITDLKSIVKIVSEATGAPSDGDKEYVITDANVVVVFAKTGGHEILQVVPRNLRVEYDWLKKERAALMLSQSWIQVITLTSNLKQKRKRRLVLNRHLYLRWRMS
jgi:hypothetical protein